MRENVDLEILVSLGTIPSRPVITVVLYPLQSDGLERVGSLVDPTSLLGLLDNGRIQPELHLLSRPFAGFSSIRKRYCRVLTNGVDTILLRCDPVTVPPNLRTARAYIKIEAVTILKLKASRQASRYEPWCL